MKRYAVLFSLVIFISLILWVGIPAQQQLVRPSGTNLKAQTQKINSLQMKINKMEKELAELRKVIKIKGGNVEIKSSGVLKLNGSTLSMNSQNSLIIKGVSLNMNATTMNVISDAVMTLKGSMIKLN